MVGRGGGRMSSGSRSRFSKKLSLALQRLDGGRPRSGLDQHENHSGCNLLRSRHSHGNAETLARKRSHGAADEARSGQLPNRSKTASSIPFAAAILRLVSSKL